MNKGCHSPFQSTKEPSASAAAPVGCAAWGDSGQRKTGHSPGSYTKGKDFSEPRLLHLPRDGKALKSTTWNVLFFLLAVIFWCSNTCFVMFFLSTKTPIYPGSSLIIFLEQSLRAIGETVSWAKVLHKFHRIKIILNLKAVCIFFFSEDTWIYQLMT